MNKFNVLLLDDEENILWVLKEGLSDKDFYIHTASTIEEAETILNELPIDACIVDIFINDINALVFVKKWIKQYPQINFIIITAQNTSTNIIESIKIGAVDIFPKPFDIKEIKGSLLNIIKLQSNKNIVTSENDLKYDFQTLNKRMLDIYKLIGRVAKSDISVLITGETGTGKEVIAKMIHNQSNRYNRPFVAINMAAIPKELIESELFGYDKGAYTGANANKVGKFEMANGGTILLDEISELDYNLQSKLLRVIQDKELSRVGSNNIIKLDVRILAATNRDLLSLMKNNKFREDLYYRLNVVNIKMPSLRDRKEDIPILVNHFISKYSHLKGDTVKIDNEVFEVLARYKWPGNIRELENTIIYLLINNSSSKVTIDDLPDNIKNEQDNLEDFSLYNNLYELALQYFSKSENSNIMENTFMPYEVYMNLVEFPLIKAALQFCKGNKSKAADLLGINRNTLRKKMDKYGIK
jgi:DNA-binding NtrC family response regulator